MNVIQIRDITKTYRMGAETIHALDGVDLDIAANEYVAIMGASGSGKSTLMNILGCLDQPTSGTYELDGKPVTRLGARALAQVRNERIGFVFQTFELLPRLSAQRNVELPLLYSKRSYGQRRKLAAEALERVGLTDRKTHRPSQLSGGQRQRVAIARALVNQPTILLADEPTGNLDSRTTAEILGLFEQLHVEGQTVIMVTHEPEVALHSRRVVRMKDGKILSDMSSREDAARYNAPSSAPPPLPAAALHTAH